LVLRLAVTLVPLPYVYSSKYPHEPRTDTFTVSLSADSEYEWPIIIYLVEIPYLDNEEPRFEMGTKHFRPYRVHTRMLLATVKQGFLLTLQ
jgi:hypothetical protein